MNKSFLSLNKIVSGLSSSLNIINKIIPIYEKAKPMLGNIKKYTKLFSNKQKSIPIKNTFTQTINHKKQHYNNPTFFK